MCEIMTWSDDETKLINKKTLLIHKKQDNDYELLNPKWNESSHYNTKGHFRSTAARDN